jgi:hypothetical protein
MDSTRASSSRQPMRPWLALGGLVAVPLYGLSLGIWGLRALQPRMLREAAGGAVALGMVALAGMALSGAAWLRAGRPGAPHPAGPGPEHWRLPTTGPLVNDGLTASAVSGH